MSVQYALSERSILATRLVLGEAVIGRDNGGGQWLGRAGVVSTS